MIEALLGNSNYLQFQWPQIAWLLPLPILMRWLPGAYHWRTALQIPFYKSIESIKTPLMANGYSLMRHLSLWSLWCLLVISASRPIWVGEAIHLPTQGRDLMIAVDISGSMDAKDMRDGGRWIRRINAVKNVVGKFIQQRQGDRMGLILFGEVPYLQAPLSFDLKTVYTLLLEAELGFAGQKTAIGDAIGLAIKRLYERPTKNRVLILLTDGANNAGKIDPIQSAKLAANEGIRIYTVGVGADTLPSGLFGFSRRRNQELDEPTLKEISKISGGTYYRARNPQELKNIYTTLNRLEPLQQEDELFRPKAELFHWPLGLALISAMLAATLLLSKPYWSLKRL